jgi:hypothetical protein
VTGRVAIRASAGWRDGGAPWSGAALEAVRARAERIDRFGALALEVAAGVLRAPFVDGLRRDVGLVIGTAFGCIATNAAYQRRLAENGAGGASPRLFAATVSNAAAGEVGIAYGIGGPTFTVSTGMVSGLAALEVARDEIAAGGIGGMVVMAVDAVGEDGRRWIDASGWPDPGCSDAAVAVAIGDVPNGGDVVAWLGGAATGLETAETPGVGLQAVAASAVAQAGRSPDTLRAIAGRPGIAGTISRALERTVEEPTASAGGLAAGGLAVLLAVVRDATDPVLVIDRCPSGQVAAAVAWKVA